MIVIEDFKFWELLCLTFYADLHRNCWENYWKQKPLRKKNMTFTVMHNIITALLWNSRALQMADI